METMRKRALIAARPAGCRVLAKMLEDELDILPAYTMDDAFELLSRDPRRIDLILATFTFDESQMMEFLQAVKCDPRVCDIPFYCARVFPGVLGDSLFEGMGAVCKECGARDFTDAAKLSPDAAARVMKKMLGV